MRNGHQLWVALVPRLALLDRWLHWAFCKDTGAQLHKAAQQLMHMHDILNILYIYRYDAKTIYVNDACMHACLPTHLPTYRHTDIPAYRQTDRQTEVEAYRQTYRHTDRHRHIHIHIHMHTYTYTYTFTYTYHIHMQNTYTCTST